MTRQLRMLGALVMAIGGAAIGAAHPIYAATTISNCPTTESALTSDIAAAGDGGTVSITCASATTIPITSTITIATTVSLDADGPPATVTLDGGGITQLFVVNTGVTFDLTELTLSHGSASGNSQLEDGGGAIKNYGNLRVANSTLSGNSAAGIPNGADGYGGAIENYGNLSVVNSTLSDNSAYMGGAIENPGPAGTVNIVDSTLSGNVTHIYDLGGAVSNSGRMSVANSIFSDNSSGLGGAIENYGNLNIAASTFSGNVAGDLGGAIENYSSPGTNTAAATITSSTFSRNRGSSGGAISNNSTVSIAGSTLSNNVAYGDGEGGALANYGPGTASVRTSTLSGNSAPSGGAIANEDAAMTIGGSIVVGSTGGNCYSRGTTIDVGYNLTDSGGTCGSGRSTGDITNADAKVGPLANNGGPSQTMALLSGSPAIDQIPMTYDLPGTSTPLCSSRDQRGQPRPDASESFCDIGAYEVQDQRTTTTTLASSASPSVPGEQLTYTATVNPAPDGGTVSFYDAGTAVSGCSAVSITGAGTVTCTVTYTSTGSHSITASYSGDNGFLKSSTTSTLTQYVDTNLSGYRDLSKINLTGAYLGGADLAGLDLSNTNFKGANLIDANLSGADLANANLKGASLIDTDLSNANLTAVNLKGAAGLRTATLTGVTWSGTMCPDGTSSGKDGGTCLNNLGP